MTLGELVEHIYFLADEEPNTIFNDKDVYRLVNVGMRRVVNKAGYPLITPHVNVTAGTREVPIIDAALDPNQNAQVSKVFLYTADGSTLIKELSRVTYDPTDTTSGEPNGYSVNGSSLFLSPAASSEYQIRASYRTQLQSITDPNELLPLSDEQQEVVTYFAVWQMKLKDDEVGTADRWRDEYEKRYATLGLHTGVYKAS